MRIIFTRNYLSLLIILFLSIAFSQQASASHAMGADLAYECVDPATHTYKVTLRFYRDCNGIEEPFSVFIDAFSNSCGQNFQVELIKEPCPANSNGGQSCEVSPLCSTSIFQSTCNGGTLPGVQAFTYSALVSLPQTCPDWTFAFDECCRNDQITNVANANGEDLYIEATLNNSTGTCNSSPVFTTLPVPFICANQPFSYNQGAVDADGDSLVYSLVTPLGAGGVLVSYNSGYSATYPITTSPANSFGFSNSTGQISFTPNGVQVAVVTVLVKEYRNGVLIGSTMRDIQIVVINLPGCGIPPVFEGVIQNTVQNGFYINNQLVQVCPGSNLSFTVLAYNPSGDSLFIESNIGTSIPNAQFTTTYISPDSIFGMLNWVPSGLDTGLNNLVITVKNKNCPISNVQSYAITIQVLAGTYAGPDLAYCPAGGPVQLQAYGGTQFTWTPAAGLSSTAVSNPLASPAQTTEYIVTSNLSNTCKNIDSVTVRVVPDFSYTLTQSEDTICRFEFVNINLSANAAYAPYTYNWAPAAGLNATNIAAPVAQPDNSTIYAVTVTSSAGCVIKDSLKVVVEGQGPAVILTSDRNNVCIGDTIHVTSLVSALPCGLNVIPCTGNYGLKETGAGTVIDQFGGTPYRGFYMDAHMQILYLASELQAMGMQRGTITDIAFDIAVPGSTAPYNGFTIKMGCTNVTQMNTFVPGLATVLNPTSFVPSGTGYNTHTFDNPYDWDGISNLIVEVCFDNNAYTQDDDVYATPTPFNSVAFAYQDNAVGCNLALANLSVNRPNTRFIYCIDAPRQLTFEWTPTNNLYTPDTVNPFVVLNQTNTYYLNVDDGTCKGGGAITLNIDTSFKVDAGPDVPFCNGNAVQLNADITGTPPVGGNVNCGFNNSPCTGTPSVKMYIPPGAFPSSVTPFDGGFFLQLEDQRTQILYRSVDLLTAGFTPGTITSIALNISAKSSAFPFQNLNIKMGCSNKTDLTTATWEPTTLVYTNPFYSTVTGWNIFTLTNNFDWDGTSNIVLEVCWDNTDNFPSSGQDQVQAANVGYNAFHTKTGALAVGCNLSAAASSVWQVVPSLRAQVCPAPPLPVTYQWQPAAGLSSDTAANPVAAPQQATTYQVTAYFGGHCPKIDTITITPQTFAYTLSNDTVVCNGNAVQLNVTGANSFIWSPDTGLSCSDCSNPIANPTDSVLYYVEIADTNTGCTVTDSVLLQVLNLAATAWFADTLVDQGTPLTLGAYVSGSGSMPFSYQWSPATYLNNENAENPVSTPLNDVLYNLTVTGAGCTDTTQINVRVHIIESPVVMPNAFTPNGDGKNDGFYPVILNGSLAQVKAFRVYNRYGEMVHNANTPWNGKFKGAEQPAGTFLYYIVIQRPLKDDENIQGSFTLLR